jgi:microcystin-dependent protein
MNPYIGEIRIFSGNFAPKGWAFCNGQLLSIQSNTALFSLLGTYYGGNGTTTFALPNLQSRIPIHQGQGPGLSPYFIGQQGGFETTTLNGQQLPQHNHSVAVFNAPGTTNRSGGNYAADSTSGNIYQTAQNSTLNASALTFTGSNQPHNNIQPYLCVSFIIALVGIYPPRN